MFTFHMGMTLQSELRTTEDASSLPNSQQSKNKKTKFFDFVWIFNFEQEKFYEEKKKNYEENIFHKFKKDFFLIDIYRW